MKILQVNKNIFYFELISIFFDIDGIEVSLWEKMILNNLHF